MVKKQQKTAAATKAKGRRKDAKAASAPAADAPFADQVKASAQQIWSAGLAAFAKAQDQGGAVLGALATEGARLQDQARGKAKDKARAAEAALDAAARRMSDMAGEVGGRAGQHWDKLEAIFEDRVARALARLGMPSAETAARLSARVEALEAEVAMLRAARAPATPKAATRKPATKASPKTAPKAPAAKTAKPTRPAKPAKGR
jgi:poly(hydroxyalkanoate) granule-associated protein